MGVLVGVAAAVDGVPPDVTGVAVGLDTAGVAVGAADEPQLATRIAAMAKAIKDAIRCMSRFIRTSFTGSQRAPFIDDENRLSRRAAGWSEW
jgi:hypothetical protein